MFRLRTIVAITALGVLAACGGSSNKAATSSASTSSTQSSSSSTSSSSLSPAELANGPKIDTGGAGGSGCSPPDVKSLPDGWWAGAVKKVDGTSIDFDLECFYVGDAANAAAKADGQTDDFVENDYYVSNKNPKTFRETFTGRDVKASCVGNGAEPFDCTVGDVLDVYSSVDHTAAVDGKSVYAFPTLWVHVTGGSADYAFMQFTP